jgi:hypothetical protein
VAARAMGDAWLPHELDAWAKVIRASGIKAQ